MTKPTRRQRLREETTQEILDTARVQMAKDGAAALSLRAIARQMGMTAPAIYRYFKNRDDLVTVLIGLAYESLRQSLETAREENETLSSWEQLLATGMAYRNWGIANAAEYVLIFGTPIPGYHAPTENTVPLARSALGVLIRVIQEGLASGDLHAPQTYAAPSAGLGEAFGDSVDEIAPALHIAIAFWGYVHGLTSLELYNHLQPLLSDPAELYRLELISQMEKFLKKENT